MSKLLIAFGFVFLNFLDKPWMTIGPNPADPSSDVIYVTYTNFNTVASILYIGDIPTLNLSRPGETISVEITDVAKRR